MAKRSYQARFLIKAFDCSENDVKDRIDFRFYKISELKQISREHNSNCDRLIHKYLVPETRIQVLVKQCDLNNNITRPLVCKIAQFPELPIDVASIEVIRDISDP